MKLAVLFPGIGYFVDMPLMYYAKKEAVFHGYEIAEVKYGGFPKDIQGSEEKIRESCELGIRYAEESLKNVDFSKYNEIIFISKSIGTAIGTAYAKKYGIDAKHIIYTPLKETFNCEKLKGIVFHGTKDPWAVTDVVRAECNRLNLPLYVFTGANHSLESGDIIKDIDNLKVIIDKTENEL